jgi:hypothetical protein
MPLAPRKRPVLNDEFKGHDLGTFDDKPQRLNAFEYPTYQFVPNINVPTAMEMISILLWDYQAKGILVADRTLDTANESTFDMWFPYAWHRAEKGDRIKNLRTNHFYVVDEVITTSPEMSKNYVRLKGTEVPKAWHPLRWDDRRQDLVSIIPAYPDTETKPYEFTEEGHLQTVDTSTWTDVVAYNILREEPGSLEGKMFAGGVQEVRPKFREEVNGRRYKGMWIDTEVRLDFWTKSNKSSEQLREWFRDFYMKYFWLLEKNGIQRILWMWSGKAENVSRWRNDIVHRSSVYWLRTEYSDISALSKIRSMEVSADVTNPNDANEVISISLNS